MLGKLFGWKRKTGPERPPPSVPEGTVVYAVGDIHGRCDLLEQLLSKLRLDPVSASKRILIFVGDYVDRGPDSQGVVELVSNPLPPFETVCLKGNHEQVLLEFLSDPSLWEQWRRFGGIETLASYGVDPKLLVGAGAPPEQIRDAFEAALPRRHHQFLRGLRSSYDCGDYHFVHAGARPGVPLEKQLEADQLWIREEFFEAGDAFGGRVVVHGHTPRTTPERRPFRIGIDTGAYLSGRLTAARFLGSDVDFLQS